MNYWHKNVNETETHRVALCGKEKKNSCFFRTIIVDFETGMASWTVFTSRLRTSRVSETQNRLNSRAKEMNSNKNNNNGIVT